MTNFSKTLLAALLVPASGACSASDDSAGGYDGGLSYGDSGSDGYGGSGSGDGSGDGGTGEDSEGGGFTPAADIGEPPPPEEEEEGDFRIPVSSGYFVYTANAETDRVAVIDTSPGKNLLLDVIDVGDEPMALVALPDPPAGGGSVAVLNVGSQDITLIETDPDLEHILTTLPAAANANAIAASPAGTYVIAYHDNDIDDGGPGTDQEVAIVSTQSHETWALAIGSHPTEIVFAPDESVVYAITADGVSVIDLSNLDSGAKPELVPVVDDPGTDPDLVEVQISMQTGYAVARIQDEAVLIVTNLATANQLIYDLPAYPTDLDIAADGSFAVLALPKQSGSFLGHVDLPATPDGLELTAMGDEYLGVAELSPTGDAALLYTTNDPWNGQGPHGDPRKRITIAHRDGQSWSDFKTIFSEFPVFSARVAPDGNNAILIHVSAPQVNPAAPWPYTMVDISVPFPIKKVQHVVAQPKQTTFAATANLAMLLVRDDDEGVKQADLVDLSTFIVDTINLGSPPASTGFVESSQKFFVSQEHPAGRITFVESDGGLQTVTGFELNDSVKD